jgi:hypothetical protein
MLVFFRRLPHGARQKEIREFIESTVKGGFFSRSGVIKRITIIERRNPMLNVTDYHGVVAIEPDSVAERVIKKLNKKPFYGKYIEIRQYYLRKAVNDPRRKHGVVNDVADARRERECRQTVEQQASFEALKSFNRKD